MENRFDFGDWGRWGIIDINPVHAEELKSALESGEDFDTGWHGFGKVEYSMRVAREDGKHVAVFIHQEMDSVFEEADLIYDCLVGDEWENLTDKMIELIRDQLAWNTEFCEETKQYLWLATDASYEMVIKAAEKLIDDCGKKLNRAFAECIATVLFVLYGDSIETERVIEERIESFGLN